MVSPVRRTTIVVSDLGNSLSFYRDILGLEVFYDQEIAAEATGQLLGVPGARVRIVSLQAEGSVQGMVGLLSFLSPAIQPRRDVQAATSHPDLAIVFATDDIGSVYERMKHGDVRIQCPPIEYEIPGRGMCTGLSCFDPDGVLVEFTQFGPLRKT